MISAAKLAEMRQEVAEVADGEGTDLIAYESIPQILGYIVACARQDGRDEADDVEIMVRLAGMLPDEVRQHERVLRQLGYVAVCDRLREIVGRRRFSLVPLV